MNVLSYPSKRSATANPAGVQPPVSLCNAYDNKGAGREQQWCHRAACSDQCAGRHRYAVSGGIARQPENRSESSAQLHISVPQDSSP